MSFKRKLCKHCKGKLEQERPGQEVHIECAADWVAAQNAKKERIAAKQIKQAKAKERAEDKVRKDKVARIEDLHKEAQRVFNQWIRLRDENEPCISCGAPPPDLSGLHAGRDAGHWRSVGAAKQLRYNEDNVHGQCVSCNQFKAGNAVAYRAGLVRKIGEDRVQALENDNRTHKWTREEVLRIRDEYKERVKEILKTR